MALIKDKPYQKDISIPRIGSSNAIGSSSTPSKTSSGTSSGSNRTSSSSNNGSSSSNVSKQNSGSYNRPSIPARPTQPPVDSTALVLQKLLASLIVSKAPVTKQLKMGSNPKRANLIGLGSLTIKPKAGMSKTNTNTGLGVPSL